MDGGALKSKVIFLPHEVGSDLPVTMWYFELPLELFAKSLWDPQVMKDFACFPQRKYTDCGSHVYDKITSADWFYEAFNNSPATESGMLKLQLGCLFVGIGHFDDSSNTDRLMKNSEQPFLQTILNLTLKRCQWSDSWMLVSLLTDLEVSDLKKSQSNQKSNGDNLSLHCLKLWWPQMLWVFVFYLQRSWPVLWSLGALHGFVWMHVYFQVGMIICDTEQHNKQDMWLLWRKWLT